MSEQGTLPILKVGNTLLTAVHGDLHDRVAEALQTDVLRAIEKTGAAGLVMDISGLDLVDSYVARILTETAQMARLMGTDSVLVGMRPQVASTLVQMGFDLSATHTALDVDAGLALLAGLERARRAR